MRFFKRRPTAEEIIDAIIPLFTKEQLESFRVEDFHGGFYDFRTQMFAFFGHLKPNCSIEKSKQKISKFIEWFRNDISAKPFFARKVLFDYIKNNLFE